MCPSTWNPSARRVGAQGTPRTHAHHDRVRNAHSRQFTRSWTAFDALHVDEAVVVDRVAIVADFVVGSCVPLLGSSYLPTKIPWYLADRQVADLLSPGRWVTLSKGS